MNESEKIEKEAMELIEWIKENEGQVDATKVRSRANTLRFKAWNSNMEDVPMGYRENPEALRDPNAISKLFECAGYLNSVKLGRAIDGLVDQSLSWNKYQLFKDMRVYLNWIED